jgi:hypothetical protein
MTFGGPFVDSRRRKNKFWHLPLWKWGLLLVLAAKTDQGI